MNKYIYADIVHYK